MEFERVTHWNRIKNDVPLLTKLAAALKENLAAGWSKSQLHCGDSTCSHCKRLARWQNRAELSKLMELETVHSPEPPPIAQRLDPAIAQTDGIAVLTGKLREAFDLWDQYCNMLELNPVAAAQLETRFAGP